MVRATFSNPTTPTVSAGTSTVGPNAEESGPAIRISKADWDHERIARRAYELYEQRGRQDGRDVEDWAKAERQLAGASRK
ncbi:MAG TPA: DUF2934 domain-containing protein [Nitrospira sp.]